MATSTHLNTIHSNGALKIISDGLGDKIAAKSSSSCLLKDKAKKGLVYKGCDYYDGVTSWQFTKGQMNMQGVP